MGITKEPRNYQQEQHEVKRNSEKVKQHKKDGKSCRTCRYFYMRRIPRNDDPDANHARCSLKGNKEVRHYNICEHHEKLVVQIIPITTSL